MTRRLNPEIFELENPIKVFSITAESFPGGVMKAHETLHGIASLDPKSDKTCRQIPRACWSWRTSPKKNLSRIFGKIEI
jgi:hypothetical protein